MDLQTSAPLNPGNYTVNGLPFTVEGRSMAYYSEDEVDFLIVNRVFTEEMILDKSFPMRNVIAVRALIDDLKDITQQLKDFYVRADIIKLDDITFDPQFKIQALTEARSALVGRIYDAAGINIGEFFGNMYPGEANLVSNIPSW
jgi:hypothetical protein